MRPARPVAREQRRSLFQPDPISRLLAPGIGLGEHFNFAAHAEAHGSALLLYNSLAVLTTTISGPLFLPIDFEIQAVSASVTTAPSGADLVWDVLIGGTTAFADTGDRVRIPNGLLNGERTVPSVTALPAFSKLQVQGVTISSAGGPIILYFELKRAF